MSKEIFNAKKNKSEWMYFKDAWNLEKKEQKVPDRDKKGYLTIEKNTRWMSPHFACKPFKYYELKFKSKSKTDKNLWGVFFYGTEEQPNSSDVYSSVYSSKQLVENINVFRGREDCITARVTFVGTEGPFSVDDLTVYEIYQKDVIKWADNLYKKLPSIDYEPEPERWKCISKTMERFKNSKLLRIVMLGDSIVNDTNNSNFEIFFKKIYPKSNIKIIPSVEGGKGCWYYIEKDRLKKYVFDKNPDILIIGGLSHNNDIESIEKVIREVKEKCDCDILLMSGPMGKDWRIFDKKGMPVFQNWESDPFNEKLMHLAENEKVEFFDMGSLWNKYLAVSGKPFEWFHRDRVHANDRGKQILGRFLGKYFSYKI